MSASTIDPAERSGFLTASRAVLKRATVRGQPGEVLLAAPRPDGTPTSVVTRDLSAAVAALCDLGDLDRARPLAEFLVRAQQPAGNWEPRYDVGGKSQEYPPAEDVTALALWALLTFARASGDRRFAERLRDPAEAAASFTLEQTLNPYLYLVETSNSVHPGAICEGYDLWTNCAHAAAFALGHRLYGGERFRRLGLLIRRSIGLLLTQDGRFLRRLDRHGYPDPRPDVTIMAPYYFGLWAPNERSVMNSAEVIERALWNVEIGGYAPHLPYSPAERDQLPGPRPLFTAWMAQFHFDVGNKDRAETILRWLFNTMRDGELPEVVVPALVLQRFGREHRKQLQQSNGGNGSQAAERAGQLAELERAELRADGATAIPNGGPHVWAHLETLRALKKGGHVDHWEAEPAEQSPQPDPATGQEPTR